AHDRDPVALFAEAEPAGPRHIRELADHADDRRRGDRALGPFVVQRDVAADDRDAECAAAVAKAPHRFGQLPGDVRLLRIAEVQAVGQPERLGADAGQVGDALEYRLDGSGTWVGG